MAEHDGAIAKAKRAGGPDIFKVTGSEKFGPHHVDEAHPAEHQHDDQQPPEVRLHDAGQNDQQEESG